MEGRIISIVAGRYEIESNNKKFIVKGSGKLRFDGHIPLVGDFVEFDPNKFMTKILDRKNFLVRPKVANIDQGIIIMSMKDPDYSSYLLNKFLAMLENKNIEPHIIFTKVDLLSDENSPKQEYDSQGYSTFELNNDDPIKYLDPIKKIFKNKLSVFIGQTGAGKSSTINSIANTSLETDEISKALGRGKHTTRKVHIIDWLDGKLIDTPGFSTLDFDMSHIELSKSFHDFNLFSEKCQFPKNCLHDKENKCEIKNKVNENIISKQRYHDYLRLLKEIE